MKNALPLLSWLAKKTLIPISFVLACALFGGCASPDFTPYVGEQDWPQGTGCNVQTNYAVPIYYGLPDKPYTVLGRITISGIHPVIVTRYAKSKGADAVVFRTILTDDAGSYTTPGHANSYTSGGYIGDQYSGFTTTTYTPGVTIPLTVTVSVYDAIKWQEPLQSMMGELQNSVLLQNAHSNGELSSNAFVATPAQIALFANALEAAAEKGNAASQYMLGAAYANGQYVKQDYAQAVKWYQQAAEQGNADAQSSLGYCYYSGEGVAQDYAEAARWYRRGAAQGNAEAQALLGCCYGAGNGVPKDYVEACKWLNLASAQGETIAKEGLPLFEKVMTPDQIAEAQRRSEAFVPQTETPTTNSPSTASP